MIFHHSRFHFDPSRIPRCVYHLFVTFGYWYKLNSIELKSIQQSCYHFVRTILYNSILSVPFIQTNLSVPYCQQPLCPATSKMWIILSSHHMASIMLCVNELIIRNWIPPKTVVLNIIIMQRLVGLFCGVSPWWSMLTDKQRSILRLKTQTLVD